MKIVLFPHDQHFAVTDLELVTKLMKVEDETLDRIVTLGAGAVVVPILARSHYHEHT